MKPNKIFVIVCTKEYTFITKCGCDNNSVSRIIQGFFKDFLI